MFRISNAVVAMAIVIGLAGGMVAAQSTTKTVTGEIVKVNLKEQTLSLRDVKSGALQRYRVEPATEITMRGKASGLRAVRPGYVANLVVRHSAEGLPVIVTMRMPDVPADVPAMPPVAQTAPAKPEPPRPAATPKPAAPQAAAPAPAPLPSRLPSTAGPLPLIGLLGAGALALASALGILRRRGSRTEG